MSHDHVLLAIIDADPHGGEYVPARRLSDVEWEIIRSPLYATEVASGDIIRVTNAETGKFEIVRRGGNVCVQFYLGENEADNVKVTASIAEQIEALIKPFNGGIDATTAGLISITIPVAVGFQAIEGIFEIAVEKSPGAQWQYSNVYDPVSGEPLGWWNE
ncbi:DUF4265 domain-containing protein [Microbulbifer sp. MLAF003]|uniref:DUF4265 domain-containing protein n=1 Tax=Microbulbifer sp. MLAF003 TaxID=3032582 RepID=UPI0024AD8D9A|nr:DUF4265 domain-containing protein [Microbulbifer sp. MLAF003]WHI49540.1 DUF4265 domain-containing protein [Microbulbifer sp. MLAF003]